MLQFFQLPIIFKEMPSVKHSGARVQVRVDGSGYPYPLMDFIYGYGLDTVLILENLSGTGRVRVQTVWVRVGYGLE